MTIVVVLTVAAIVWLSVLRDVKAPITSADDGPKPAGRPSAADCAEIVSEVTNPTTAQRAFTSEIRDRFRQCFGRR